MSLDLRPETAGESQQSLAAASPLLGQSESLPYRFLPGLARSQLEKFSLEAVTQKLAAPESGVLAHCIDGEFAGIVTYGPLPWETNILQRKVMSLSLFAPSSNNRAVAFRFSLMIEEAIDRIRAYGGELVTTKTYTTEIAAVHALETHGFHLMDTVVESTFRFNRTGTLASSPCPEGFSMRLANADDVAELRRVSHAAFASHFGRWHADPVIGQETATRIYEEWIQSCVNGWGDWIVLAEFQGRIAGFSVWKKPSATELRHNLSIGHYSIGAIHPDFFGRGLFKFLTLEGMRLLQGVADFIEGPTHVHNLPVQRGYLKLGWQIVDSRHSFHKWIR